MKSSRLAAAAVVSLAVLSAQREPPSPAPGAAPGPRLQQPAAPREVPAIELLLREPRTLDADRVRRRWARVLGTDVAAAPGGDVAWLRADGSLLAGAARGVRFEVTASGAARPLAPGALRHLDGRQAAALRAHVAHVVVRAPEPAATPEARTAAYAVLAGVAAALLDGGVVAVGAAEHGTFEPVDGVPRWRELLAGDHPLAALAPMVSTSLVAFLRAAPELVEATLEKALAKELGVPFGGDAPSFVSVRDGTAMVGIDGEFVVVSVRPRQRVDRVDERMDLRLREALQRHEALLHVACHGAPEDAPEQQRRRTVARVVAALWNDDVLALSWHCDRRLVAAGQDVPAQLRADDPVAATFRDPVVPILEPTDPEAMAKAIAAARAAWPSAVEHHRAGGELSAKFAFPRRSGGEEHVWVTVTAIDGDTVRGVLANEPHDLDGKKLGSEVGCKLSDLSDWLFLRGGSMVGGFTVKVLDAQQRRAK